MSPLSRRVGRYGVLLRAISISLLAAPAAIPSDSITRPAYPGPDPGPFSVTLEPGVGSEGSRIEVRNRAISATWRLTSRGLQPGPVQDVAVNQSLHPTGEVFQIVLGDSTRYLASELTPASGPRLNPLAPDPAASCGARWMAGHEIVLPLRAADGRLQLEWRVIARDGGNYVRQELRLQTPARLDLREILWCDESLPYLAAGGAVDGSPVTAGTFFLGGEDPMARNGLAAAPGGATRVTCRQPRPAPLLEGE